MKKILIACASTNKVIGRNNKLPWKKIKEDMEHFRKTTINKTVIMGRKTYESLPCPLINRRNIVITSTPIHPKKYESFKTLEEAMQKMNGDCYIIGGQQLYQTCLDTHQCDEILLTTIGKEYSGDTYFPDIPFYFNKVSSDLTILNSPNKFLLFDKYIASNDKHQEHQYLNLLKQTLISEKRTTRNGTTRTLFSPPKLIFDISLGFPLLTTKKLAWKSIIRELLFFISGKTNTNILSDKGVNIWKHNTSQIFLNSRNLNYISGDMGPMYGFNWRHFGDKYIGCDSEYNGFDQLNYIIDLIVNDPQSRRIIMTTFDPSSVSQSVLMPCHGIVIQYYVRDNYVDCHMYQRSADIFIGLPYNIASYALLLEIICNISNVELKKKNIRLLNPGKLHITIGDCHLYEEHYDSAIKQLNNAPLKWNKLYINEDITMNIIKNDVYSIENLIKLNRNTHPYIHGAFVV